MINKTGGILAPKNFQSSGKEKNRYLIQITKAVMRAMQEWGAKIDTNGIPSPDRAATLQGLSQPLKLHNLNCFKGDVSHLPPAPYSSPNTL